MDGLYWGLAGLTAACVYATWCTYREGNKSDGRFMMVTTLLSAGGTGLTFLYA